MMRTLYKDFSLQRLASILWLAVSNLLFASYAHSAELQVYAVGSTEDEVLEIRQQDKVLESFELETIRKTYRFPDLDLV